MIRMTDNFSAAAALSPMVQPVELHQRGMTLSTLFSVQTLKLAAQHLSQAQHKTHADTRDLVGLLLSQAARNRRISLPMATVRMHLPVKSQELAVRLYYGA